jgi:hypothetical protein
MDFKQKYKKYSKEKFSCSKPPSDEPITIAMGYGGSENMVVLYKDYVLKIVPNRLYHTIQTADDDMEILFYKLFTKRFLLTDKTPHIVGFYQNFNCDDIRPYIKHYEREFGVKKCASVDDVLVGLQVPAPNIAVCKFNSMIKYNVIGKDFQLNVLEKCDEGLDNFLLGWTGYISSLDKAQIAIDFEIFLFVLDDFLFQIIFTLTIIQDRYPWFSHRDLFAHNVLLSMSKIKDDNAFNMYHYGGKHFYLPASRHCTKLNDFGFSIIDSADSEAIISKKVDKNRNFFEYEGDTTVPIDRKKPDHKNDLLLFLTDLYGMRFYIRQKFHDLYPQAYDLFVSKIGEYIDLSIIDSLKKDFGGRGVQNSKLLQRAIKTPRELLMGGLFDYLTEPLPEGAKILNHYNR